LLSWLKEKTVKKRKLIILGTDFAFPQELEQRHNAVLQMYGEKAEQAEELRMDLEDVKSMYKSQVPKREVHCCYPS